jgi:hypothetical protein
LDETEQKITQEKPTARISRFFLTSPTTIKGRMTKKMNASKGRMMTEVAFTSG